MANVHFVTHLHYRVLHLSAFYIVVNFTAQYWLIASFSPFYRTTLF